VSQTFSVVLVLPPVPRLVVSVVLLAPLRMPPSATINPVTAAGKFWRGSALLSWIRPYPCSGLNRNLLDRPPPGAFLSRLVGRLIHCAEAMSTALTREPETFGTRSDAFAVLEDVPSG